jgi:HEAT repeat protein
MSATVGVDRYYKGGGATPQITVTFFVARDPRHSDLPFQQLATGEYALFFLKEGSGRYTFSDPWFGKLEVSRRLAEDTADTHDPATLLEADLRAGLAEASRDLLLDNIRLLGNLRRLRSSRELHPFASSDDLEVRGAANLALMRVGDYSMIEEAVEFLLLQDPNPRIRALQGKLANEFESVKDPATLDVIHRYMRSDNQMVRIAMVKAAERIHSPKAVPWLVERLDDPVEDVRYHAVLALCEMEGKGPGGWGAAIDVYDQNESQYISKWKQWWETEGKFKYR